MTPFPLDGGRAGVGGEALDLEAEDAGGTSRDLPDLSRAHPLPNPSPIEGEGLVRRARRLREHMTLGEQRLWTELRRSPLHFRKQALVGRYVVDFVSHRAKLVIEVDGPPHRLFADVAARDAERDAWLAAQGYRVLRFTNAQVIDHLAEVLAAIQGAAA
jgi:very-short-patch-repair endonuclease